jgi:DNA-binding winged helix-turn-helix (wHTH) protein
MKIVYLINELILFSPDSCTLTPRETFPAGRVTLHGPAAECLRLLLSEAGHPVTQKTLFEQVWHKKGVVVSTNTLYQSIASIRKGLKAAGLHEEIIRTLPKQGFQCNARVQSGPLEDFITSADLTANNAPGSVIAAEPVFPVEQKKNKPGLSLILSVLISLAIIVGLLYWMKHSDLAPSPEYYLAGQIENCQLYSSWSGDEYSQEIFNELRQRYPLNCAKKQVVYLTINRLQEGSSLILCHQRIEQPGAQCRSVIFKDDDNEHQ